MGPLSVGSRAPDFRLKDQDGKTHSLSDHEGKTIVLYFYPKDDTPGCTMQACDFRDHNSEFEKKGAVIMGISPDDVASHKRFQQKYGFHHVVLADEEAKVAQQYGAWGKKSFMGKESIGLIRTTVIIDGHGTVKSIFSPVKPEGHWKEIMDVI